MQPSVSELVHDGLRRAEAGRALESLSLALGSVSASTLGIGGSTKEAATARLVAAGHVAAGAMHHLGSRLAHYELRLSPVPDAEARSRAAAHEAGHAVAAVLLDLDLERVLIMPEESPLAGETHLVQALTFVHGSPASEAPAPDGRVVRFACFSLAGLWSEMVLDPEVIPVGCGSDLNLVALLAETTVAPERREVEIARWHRATAMIVRAAAPALRAVATGLLAHGELDGEQTVSIAFDALGPGLVLVEQVVDAVTRPPEDPSSTVSR